MGIELTIKAVSAADMEQQIILLAERFQGQPSSVASGVSSGATPPKSPGRPRKTPAQSEAGAAEARRAGPEVLADGGHAQSGDVGALATAEGGDDAETRNTSPVGEDVGGEEETQVDSEQQVVAGAEGEGVGDAQGEGTGLTLDDIQAAARTLAGLTSFAAVLDLFKAHGVVKPKDTPAEKFAEIMAAFEAAIADAKQEAA